MKILSLLLVAVTAIPCAAQESQKDISPAQLKDVLDLPLSQAIQKRDQYKVPLKAAYDRQSSLVGKDCRPEMSQGQQPYNICIASAAAQANKDYASFYGNLQMLCHSQEELAALQRSEASWLTYREDAMKAAQTNWPDGTGSPGFIGSVYLSLLRDRMHELYIIYDLNISQ